MILSGYIVFKQFAEGSKSSSIQPYLVMPDNTEIRITIADDNPFENNLLKEYEGRHVILYGQYCSVDESLFEVTGIFNQKEEPSDG